MYIFFGKKYQNFGRGNNKKNIASNSQSIACDKTLKNPVLRFTEPEPICSVRAR